ncbi:MAG: glycosyltransferase family 39 protein, partial [Microgenomates group bacterium]
MRLLKILSKNYQKLSIRVLNFGWEEKALILIFLIACYLRLYNIPSTVQFLGDQGRDAIIVSKIFKEGDLAFIGPVTSVGNLYLGPLYYYFMLPFLWLSYPSPLGPVYAVAALSIFTTSLMYLLGKHMFGKRTALIATALFAFSSTVVTYARFSWNPNPAPFVSLWIVYSVWRSFNDPRWWVVAILGLSVIIQLHYLTLLTFPAVGIIWLYQVWSKSKSKKLEIASILKPTAIGVVIFVISLLPLLLFDLKHNWLNTRAFYEMFFGESEISPQSLSTGQKLLSALAETHGRSLHILFEITIGKVRSLNTVLLLAGIAAVAQLLRSKYKHQLGLRVLLVFFLVSVGGTAFYQHTIFDHYIAYLFPITMFLLAILINELLKIKIIGPIASFAFMFYFIAFNLKNYPLQSLGWTVLDMQQTTRTILDRVDQNEPYNLVLMSPTGDIEAQSYRYFLLASEKPPL